MKITFSRIKIPHSLVNVVTWHQVCSLWYISTFTSECGDVILYQSLPTAESIALETVFRVHTMRVRTKQKQIYYTVLCVKIINYYIFYILRFHFRELKKTSRHCLARHKFLCIRCFMFFVLCTSRESPIWSQIMDGRTHTFIVRTTYF